MIETQVTRRDVLKFSALGAAVLTLPFEQVVRAKAASTVATRNIPAPYTKSFAVPDVIDARFRAENDPVIIKQEMKDASILNGLSTKIFGYNGMTPGPTIHCRRGKPITVQMENALPDTHPQWNYTPWTSCHLHGSASKPQYDGYASDITQPGQKKTYHYPNKQDARTLWYHDHGVHHTAENAYMGLAAQYHLHDETEDALDIPKWDFNKDRPLVSAAGAIQQYDVPLIIADKIFDANGNFRYDDNGHSGVYGDVILVNGVAWPNMKVHARKYRFRVLNASLSRGYRLQVGTGSIPMTVIGTDGGLMPKPQNTTQLRLGMAERYEVIIDFTGKAGQKIELRNLGVPNSTDFDNTGKIMQFEVIAEAPYDNVGNPATVPAVLNQNQEVMGLTEAMSKGTTKIAVVRSPEGIWKIQAEDAKGVKTDMTWDDIVKSNYSAVVSNPGLGDVQVWEITNKSGGWFHPVHIHLVDFKILSRNGRAPFNYELGPKDVAYVGENETVRAIMRFGTNKDDTDCSGRYMIHCHNLPHEDHDMMTQFRVGGDTPENDPMTADPAK